jgi:Mg-chelatase subunit ChlD
LPDDVLEGLGSTRMSAAGSRGRRTEVRARSGRYRRAEPVSDLERPTDLAVDATLRSVALAGVGREPPIPRSCWKRKVRARIAQSLVVFAVDASDSMATQQRLRLAKGAALTLLRDAYLRRDRVAVVAFEGKLAQVLLPPTQSVERARESLRNLPIGGTTPLSAGLKTAWSLIVGERRRNSNIAPTLVLLTDGQANVPLDPLADPRLEVLAWCDRIRADGIRCLVVDVVVFGPTHPELSAITARLDGRLLRVGVGGAGAILDALRSR